MRLQKDIMNILDIIEKMILLVMKQEVCDENTKLLVQLSY